jgi:uncharacterized Zn finger protein
MLKNVIWECKHCSVVHEIRFDDLDILEIVHCDYCGSEHQLKNSSDEEGFDRKYETKLTRT